MKINELQMHCGNCSLVEMCGTPFNFSICTIIDVQELEEAEYKELYTKAESLFEIDLSSYDDTEDTDFENDYHEAVCKKIIEFNFHGIQ